MGAPAVAAIESSVLLSASRMAVEPWSSIDEKLSAIETLKESGLTEYIPVLEEAFQLIGLNRQHTHSSKGKGTPAAGEVSAAAAKALGQFRDGIGLPILASYILSPECSRPLRESAAAGLAGLTNQSAVRLMTQALEVGDRDVRFRILLAARESFDRVGDWNADHLQELLDAVLAIALSREASPREQASLEFELVTLLLARFGTRRTESQLEAVLLKNRDPWASEMALKILVRRGANDLSSVMLETFVREDRPASLYTHLAANIVSQGSLSAAEAAKSVLSHYSFLGRIASLFSSVERERRAVHVEAAHSILDKYGILAEE